MNHKLTLAAVAAVATLGLASAASASTVFFDGFEADALGAPVGSLTNFNITGTVDVVGASNPYGIVAASNVLDLDGTPGPGMITSKNSFAYNAGDTVTLSFLLGGAQRGSVSDDASVSLTFGATSAVQSLVGTGLFSFVSFGATNLSTFTAVQAALAGNTPYTASSLSFVAVNAGSLGFSFGSNSHDNVGPLLDDVQLDIGGAVPEPATWALMIGGFGMAGAALRRRRAVAATA
jgi:hypothetical protein